MDQTAAMLSALVGERQGRTVEANVSRERNGRVTGKLVYDVPLAKVHELIDPTLSGERLLYRLFNERGVRVCEQILLAAVCRCSAAGVDAMLRSFPSREVKGMIGDDGMIGVTCEFCSTKRVFNPADYGG